MIHVLIYYFNVQNFSGTDVTVFVDIALAMANLYIHCRLGKNTKKIIIREFNNLEIISMF